jgi:hypothetical protein
MENTVCEGTKYKKNSNVLFLVSVDYHVIIYTCYNNSVPPLCPCFLVRFISIISFEPYIRTCWATVVMRKRIRRYNVAFALRSTTKLHSQCKTGWPKWIIWIFLMSFTNMAFAVPTTFRLQPLTDPRGSPINYRSNQVISLSTLDHLNDTRMPCKRSESDCFVSAISERPDCYAIEIVEDNRRSTADHRMLMNILQCSLL